MRVKDHAESDLRVDPNNPNHLIGQCMYQWLDRAPLGRNETGLWFRRQDEYGD